jgi:NADH-quinone oxidoreductase subunit I
VSVFTSTFEALGVTLRNLTRKPNTVMHPFVKRERSARYRQTFALLHEANGDEACIGCKKCEKICPSEVITVVATKHESAITGKKRGWAEDFTLDLTACIVCELCVQVCPVDAIVMCSVPTKPGFAREDLLLTMDRLYANESIPRSPYTGTSLVESHAPDRGVEKAPAEKPPA